MAYSSAKGLILRVILNFYLIIPSILGNVKTFLLFLTKNIRMGKMEDWEKRKRLLPKRQQPKFINYIPKLFADEGKQCYVTCSLDSISEFSLVLSAGTGYTAGKNLRTFGNELSESCNIFVIDVFNFFSAEYANFLSSAVCSVLACGSLFSIHD
jgi:hypothetical protein